MSKSFKLFASIVLIFQLTSCDNSNNDNRVPDPAVNTPSEAPPPAAPPVVPPVRPPAEIIYWTSVKTNYMTDMVVEGECEYPWVMTIRNNGTFTRGPCEGRIVRGRITLNELAELKRRANLVAEDINTQPVCNPLTPITEEYYQISVPNKGTKRFYDVNIEDRQICYRGGRSDAQNLKEYLVNSILIKYYHPL